MSARSQNRRSWMIGGAMVAALISGGGWYFGIGPQLSSTSSIREDAATARTQNVVLQAKNAKLKLQNEQAGALRASLAVALANLPSDGGLTTFTRQLSAQATAHKVALTTITVGAAAALAGAAPATAGSALETSAAPVQTSTAATPSAAPATGAAAPSNSIVAIPIALSATGLGRNAMAFLKDIQVAGPRRALVTASQLSPTGGSAGIDGPCTLNLTVTIFSAPLAPTAKAALEKLISGR